MSWVALRTMGKRLYEIDGAKFSTLEEFAACFSAGLLEDYRWQGHLDAFNDILRGGFGTPADGFILHWKNSALSRERLGYAETIKWLEACLLQCHSSNVPRLSQELAEAKDQRGPTLFDMLVEIIHAHGPGGAEQADNVELQLL